AEPVPPPPCGDYWVVTPGDTLWAIASRCYPGEHTGRVVDAIQRANPGLDAGRLQVGQRLVLPERGRRGLHKCPRCGEALPAPNDAELASRYFPALFDGVLISSATKGDRLRKIAELAKGAR